MSRTVTFGNGSTIVIESSVNPFTMDEADWAWLQELRALLSRREAILHTDATGQPRAADIKVRMPGEGDDPGCWLTEFMAKAMHAERLAGTRWETMASSRRWRVMDGTERRFSADQLKAMYDKQVLVP